MACKGVDLTHPRWIMAGASLVPHQTPVADWSTELVLDKDRSFWKRVGKNLAIESFNAEIPDNTEDLVKNLFADESKFVDRMVFGSENLKGLFVAFALPYQIPRIARRTLHHLYNFRSLKENPKENRSAIEAPIALALECVARKLVEIDSPSSLLLLTGFHSTLELTAATITREDNTLRIEITDYTAIDPTNLAGSLRHLGGKHQQTRLFHATDPDSAEEVSRGLNRNPDPDELIDLGPNAVAIGAVRHGGLLLKQRWLGNPIDKLEVKRIAPVALGILGTNGEAGDWFWRRVVEKGSALTREPLLAGLYLGKLSTEKIALAECPDPEFAEKDWLSQKDEDDQDVWSKAGLRWHEVINNSEPVENWDLQVRMVPTSVQLWNSLACPSWKIISRSEEPEKTAAESTSGP